MRVDFQVEVLLHAARQEKIAQEASGFDKERHTAPLQQVYDASKACAMAQEILLQRFDSASSCFLPAFVRR